METTTVGRALVGQQFHSVDAAVAAAGDRTAIDYMAVTGGHRDVFSQFASDAAHLRVALEDRGFDSRQGDVVQVWVPQG